MTELKNPKFDEIIFEKVVNFLAIPIKWTDSRIKHEENIQEAFELEEEKLGKKNDQLFFIAILNLLGLTLGFTGYLYESIFKLKDVVEKVCIGAVCNDGWLSYSTGPGTCSWHSGVHHYVYKEIITGQNKTYETVYLGFLVGLILITIYYYYTHKKYRRIIYFIILFSVLNIVKLIFYTITITLSMTFFVLIFIPRSILNIPSTIKFIFLYLKFTIDMIINNKNR